MGGNIATYGFVWFDHNNGHDNIYTIVDDHGNIMLFKSREEIKNTDGEHYFLVKGKVKEHREKSEQKQTIFSSCVLELVDKYYKIHDTFFGEIESEVEFSHVTARFRFSKKDDFLVTGQEIKLMPTSEYRMIVEKGGHMFILPFDSKTKISPKTKGKYNIYAKVIGYSMEDGHRSTVLYPTRIECKNGPTEGGTIKGFIGIGPWA
ncbi:MAG: hypothetical protein FWC02_00645 [Firmicutes bacterium]|nr:hypothetical protein [Bacillota bacterium]